MGAVGRQHLRINRHCHTQRGGVSDQRALLEGMPVRDSLAAVTHRHECQRSNLPSLKQETKRNHCRLLNVRDSQVRSLLSRTTAPPVGNSATSTHPPPVHRLLLRNSSSQRSASAMWVSSPWRSDVCSTRVADCSVPMDSINPIASNFVRKSKVFTHLDLRLWEPERRRFDTVRSSQNRIHHS